MHVMGKFETLLRAIVASCMLVEPDRRRGLPHDCFLFQPLLLEQDLEGVLRIMQDPRRALNEAASAAGVAVASDADATAEAEEGERHYHRRLIGLPALERRDSRTLGGFLLRRRTEAITEGGQAASAVARTYHLRSEEDEGKGEGIRG